MSNWTEDDHMSPEQELAIWEEEEASRVRRDAARWRISQITYPRWMDDPFGYFTVRGEDDNGVIVRVGIQPHPVTGQTALGACILGRGDTEGEAIDQMFATLDALVDGGAVLPVEIEAARALAKAGVL